MKTLLLHDKTQRILLVTILLMGIFLFSSCARKIAFSTSTVVPAAKGSVKVKKDGNSNYKINLNVKNLADPNRLNPPKNNYVVWMETRQNGTKNIGRLNTSSGLFSNKLKSSLTTVTPFKPARFFITAENDVSIQYPGMDVVLRTPFFK